MAHFSNIYGIGGTPCSGKSSVAQAILSQSDQPEVAFTHWMERDARFANAVGAMAERLGLAVIRVDGKTSLEDNIARVDQLFIRSGLMDDPEQI